MKLPAEEKRGVPAYMVSFGDMITLLLTFFILLVALADTQSAGMVGIGRGPLIKHFNARGQPAILPGRMREVRQSNKTDAWWIPSQEGDPDELERVVDKLARELQTRFKADEASIRYSDDEVVLRLPARITYQKGRPTADQALTDLVAVVGEALRGRPERRVRIHGDVPPGTMLRTDLGQSATQGRVVMEQLIKQGVRPHQISLWGWGASRLAFPQAHEQTLNQGLTLEIIDPPRAVGR